MRNANLDTLKQLVKGLSETEKTELLESMLSNPSEHPKTLPPTGEITVIEHAVQHLELVDYRDYGLSEAQYFFCMEYVQNGFNATRAYMTVFGTKHDSANVLAVRMRNNPSVASYLEAVFERIMISNNEIQLRIQDMLAVSLDDFIDDNGEGIDLLKAKKAGALRGIQRLRKTQHGWDIQLYDRVKLLDVMTRVRGMQKQVKITADLDNMAREFGMDAEILHVMKDQMKKRIKQELLSEGGGDET